MAKKTVADLMDDDAPQESPENGKEYGAVAFAPECPYCGEKCKSYASRGPLAHYRCENPKCEQYMKFAVKVPRPWRPFSNLAGSSRQMNVAARENMKS